MTKQYELVGAKTYGTTAKIFRAGVIYSEEEVESVVDDANDLGEPYFAEVGGEPKEPEHKKGVVIVGGKKKKDEPKKSEGGASGTDEQGKSGESTVVTV